MRQSGLGGPAASFSSDARGVEALAAETEAQFTAHFGHRPTTLVVAPGRVNLLGEHTDYNEGYVLPCAIDRYLCVAAARRCDNLVRCQSPGRLETSASLSGLSPRAAPPGWARYPLGIAWALGEAGRAVDGVDLFVHSDLPAGAGLASSAALTCATGLALTALSGECPSRNELAQACQRAENEFVGAPTGLMDQMICLHGQQAAALLLDCRDLSIELVPFDPGRGGYDLLIFDTQVHHDLTDGGYAARRRDCANAAHKLGLVALRDLTPELADSAAHLLSETEYRLAAHVLSENRRTLDGARLLAMNDIASFARLFFASHTSLRDDFLVSCAELDTAVDAALSAGAAGARMTGAGFGGCVIALVEKSRSEAVVDAVQSASSQRGYRSPLVAQVTPVGSARVLNDD
jgi:galactokinase